jgi:hypothetical protein
VRRGQGWPAARSAFGASTLLHRREGPPGFPPTPRPQGPTSLFTIDGAITPRRDAFADLPALGGFVRLWRSRPPCRRPLNRGWKPLPQGSSPHKAGRRRRQGDLRDTAHPEPLPSSDDRCGLPGFPPPPAPRPGLPLRYQWRDYAPCRGDPPATVHSIAAGSRSHRRPARGADRSQRATARSAVSAGGSWVMRASLTSARTSRPVAPYAHE